MTENRISRLHAISKDGGKHEYWACDEDGNTTAWPNHVQPSDVNWWEDGPGQWSADMLPEASPAAPARSQPWESLLVPGSEIWAAVERVTVGGDVFDYAHAFAERAAAEAAAKNFQRDGRSCHVVWLGRVPSKGID